MRLVRGPSTARSVIPAGCRRALYFASLILLPLPADAFKMGASAVDDAQSAVSFDAHFGDPVHERMTTASLQMARSHAASLCGGTDAQHIDAFVAQNPAAQLSHLMCCHQGTRSTMCDRLKSGRTAPFIDASNTPLVSAVRWNDDICHMTRESSSSGKWTAGWMNGIGVERFNNLNYASHYHELQFLHAMAPTERTKPYVMQDAKGTIRRIMVWAEFSFRVADGSIPSTTTLKEVIDLLPGSKRKDFELAWNSWSRFRVDELFTGVKGAPPAQVRQMALGALMHTVQDSFSSSHVQRERDPTVRYAPLVGAKGNIVRFHSYRLQSPSKHGTADARPDDAERATPGQLHPVAISAELLACAAAGSDSGRSRWELAEKAVTRTFTLANPAVNLAANAGTGYEARNVNDLGP